MALDEVIRAKNNLTTESTIEDNQNNTNQKRKGSLPLNNLNQIGGSLRDGSHVAKDRH